LAGTKGGPHHRLGGVVLDETDEVKKDRNKKQPRIKPTSAEQNKV